MTRPCEKRATDSYLAALRALDAVRFRLWECCDLTIAQLRVIRLISDLATPSVGDLAAEMKVEPSTVTGIVDRLARRHFVERCRDEADRRVVRLRLSAEGKGVLDDVTAAGRAYLERVFAALGDEEVAGLINSFERFAAAARSVAQCREDH